MQWRERLRQQRHRRIADEVGEDKGRFPPIRDGKWNFPGKRQIGRETPSATNRSVSSFRVDLPSVVRPLPCGETVCGNLEEAPCRSFKLIASPVSARPC